VDEKIPLKKIAIESFGKIPKDFNHVDHTINI
jgi:hypothetical protein